MSIKRDKIHFAEFGNCEKVKEGPTSAIPGPTLPTADATALIEVNMLTPKRHKKIEPSVNTNRYKKIKANKLYVMVFEITCLFNITGITAFGCNLLLNSNKPFLINKIILTILIPPLVLPAEAPEKRNRKKMNERKDPHKV
tara:strand:- start:114 stop:536 length:423 start_codon:yes stop_codon:yes gene_type:complete